jgi:hypothetical protein
MTLSSSSTGLYGIPDLGEYDVFRDLYAPSGLLGPPEKSSSHRSTKAPLPSPVVANSSSSSAFAARGGFLAKQEDTFAKDDWIALWSISGVLAFYPQQKYILPETTRSLFGQTNSSMPLNFGEPRPTSPPTSSPPSIIYEAATSTLSFGRIPPPRRLERLEPLFAFESGFPTPATGIFGRASSSKAPYNLDKNEFEPTIEVATFLSSESHAFAKERFDAKLKMLKDRLPLPSRTPYPNCVEGDVLWGRCREEDVALGGLASISLLEDLVKIEEMLQLYTVGYTDKDMEIDVGGSWMEGVYIASIQRKLVLIDRNWKANMETSSTDEIEAVDEVLRSPYALKVLFGSITG